MRTNAALFGGTAVHLDCPTDSHRRSSSRAARSLSSAAPLIVALVISGLVACSSAPVAREADHASAAPATLTGEAREIMRRLLTEIEPSAGPGSVTGPDGTSIAYDQYIVVGSTLTVDRGQRFQTFVDSLQSAGGDFETIETTQGFPSRVFLIHDGTRYVVSVGRW